MSTTKPWGGAGSTGIGSWAADAEAELAETEAAAAAAAANPKTFPSLKESVSSKPKKKKMTLSEFYVSTGQPDSRSGSSATRLTPDEMAHLPTGPTLRSPDEYVSGSRGWGGGGGGMNRDRGGGGGGSGGGGPRREYDAPPPPISRADEVDDWGAGKRNVPMSRETRGSSSSNSRYGDLGGGGGDGGGGSRADDNDNWSFGKKPAVVVGPTPTRSSNFGSDWRKGGDSGPTPTPREEPVERRRLVLDPRSSNNEGNVVNNNNNAVNKENPFGAARPREEVLTGKGLDWKKLDSDYELKKVSSGVGVGVGDGGGSRPTSSQSNREENVGVGGVDVGEVKTRVKVNPFGDAKPREVLLEEKGLDWRKIDLQLEHRHIDRPDTEEEKALKEEIENLKKDLEKESVGNDVSQNSGDTQTNLQSLIQSKEKNLEILIRELDDKIRFSQRPGSGAGRPGSEAGRPGSAAGRPGSGAGRPGSGGGRHMGYMERPPHSVPSYDDYMDRPRSRGQGGDVWNRPGEERRGGFYGNVDGRRGGFQGSRDERRGGFQGNRDERRGGFQGDRDERRGGFQGNRDERRGGFQGNRDGGGFQGNRDFNRPTSRDSNRW